MSGFHFELANCEQTILHEIATGHTQASVALTYAMAMSSSERTTIDWPKVNRAIMARWTGRAALDRVKRMAWKNIESRADEGETQTE